MSSRLIVCLDGIIGAGKSSILRKLENVYECYKEPVEKWTLLSKFYSSTRDNDYATALQFQILLTQYEQTLALKKKSHGLALVERCPWTSRNVFVNLLAKEGRINLAAVQTYTALYEKLKYDVDHFIYLQINAEKAHKRLKERRGEERVTLEYLRKLEACYEEQLGKRQNVYTLDADRPLGEVVNDVQTILQEFHPVLHETTQEESSHSSPSLSPFSSSTI